MSVTETTNEKFLTGLEGAYLDAEAFAALTATDSGAPVDRVESSHTGNR